MPSLDSPLLTLGALFLVGQDSRGRQFTGGESGKGLLAAGFAGGSAEWAANEARSALNLQEDAVSDELAQALLGAGISRFGGMVPQNKAMARGIMYNSAIQAMQGAGVTAEDLLGDFSLGGGGSSAPQSAHMNTQPAHTSPGGGVNSGGVVY